MNLLNFENNRAKILNYLNKNREYNQLLLSIHNILPNLNDDTIEIKIDNTGTVRVDHIDGKDMLSLIVKDSIVFTSIVKNDTIKHLVSEELFHLEDRDLAHFHFNFLVSDFCLKYIERFLKSNATYYGKSV